VHGDTEDLVKETMVDDHSDERSGGQQRIHLTKGSFAYSCLDIRGQVVIKDSMVFPEEHFR
jgi:hypothetical protein